MNAAPLQTEPAAAAGGEAAGGLVTCAKSARVSVPAGQDGVAGQGWEHWSPKFPTPELVSAAAVQWGAVEYEDDPDSPGGRRPKAANRVFEQVLWDGTEGPRPAIMIGPGVISICRQDQARRERAYERAEQRRRQDIDAAVAAMLAGDPVPEPGESMREVTGWSRKSRARMVKTLAGLDWTVIQRAGWAPAMLTLTYPGDWLTVAPNGKAAKKHLRTLEKRWVRAWGFEPIWVWKLEFQDRGAPHFHLFGLLPAPYAVAGEHRRLTQVRYRPAVGDGLGLKQWLSAVWADIVAHPDPEQRRRHKLAGTGVDYAEGVRNHDPRRLAVYFSKHGTYRAKEYQNRVPAAWSEPGQGPGRFWGYKGLKLAVQGVPIESEDALWAERILRRYSRAQGVTRQTEVLRVEQATGRVRTRRCRRRVIRFPSSRGGFMCVNDGPALAIELARAVKIAHRSPDGYAPTPARQQYGSTANAVVLEFGTWPEVPERHRPWPAGTQRWGAPPPPPAEITEPEPQPVSGCLQLLDRGREDASD